jgi:hypothetical protein
MSDEDPQVGDSASTDDIHIRTFLVADVRGYTLFTQERGDEAVGRTRRSSRGSHAKGSRPGEARCSRLRRASD